MLFLKLCPHLQRHQKCDRQHETCDRQHETCDRQHETCDRQHETCAGNIAILVIVLQRNVLVLLQY